MNITRALIALLTAATLPVIAQAATLDVTIEDISKAEGTIRMGIYDAAGYENGQTVAGASIVVDGAQVTATIEGLAPGEYGIKLYHDVDDDGEMGTNPFGMPTEPYAFSNNAKGRFGPAKWDAAKFSVSEEGATHTISFK